MRKGGMSFSVAFPMGLPRTPPAANRRKLQTQHLGVAAVDAGYICFEPTQLYLNVEFHNDKHVVVLALENATGQPLFVIKEKTLSLHRQRTILDAHHVPVATMRMGAFRRRKATYSVFPRAEHAKMPVLYKFTVADGSLQMDFHDIMTGEACRLGCAGESGDVEVWLQRGVEAKGVRQPVAHMYSGPLGSPAGYTVDIAEGVDAVMVLLVCIALHDADPVGSWRRSSMY